MKRLDIGTTIGPVAYTKRQTQDLLQLGLSTVDQLIAEGKLEAFRIGKSVRITAASIDALVAHGLGRRALLNQSQSSAE